MFVTKEQIIVLLIGGAFVGALIAYVINLLTFNKRKDEFVLRSLLMVANGLVRKEVEEKTNAIESFDKEFICPKCGNKLDADATAICVDKENNIWSVTCSHCGAEKIIDVPNVIDENVKLK